MTAECSMSDQYAFEFTELVTPDYAPKLTIDERERHPEWADFIETRQLRAA